MTSLEFIMDMDVGEEPQNNKKDGPSSTSGTRQDRDISASDHANPEEHQERLNTGNKQRRGNSGRHTKSSAGDAAESSTTAALSSSSTARPAPARGSSNTSNEDMYRHGSHPSGSGGGEQPNRPMGNPSGNPEIKLTPITGRVSRAKKGVPVHTCDLCRPPKTFTRAEHLRRHQLSHQTAGFPCTYPGCDRAFHRADLLARHATRHDQEGDKASSTSRGTTGDSSRRASTSTSGGYDMAHGRPSSQGPMPQGPDMTSNAGASYSGGTPYHQYSTSGGPPMSPPRAPGRRESYQSNSSGAGGYTHTPQIPTINQPHMDDSAGGMTYEPLSSYQSPRPAQGLLIVTTGIGADAPGLLAPDASPWASDSSFSTPSDTHRMRYAPAYSPPTSLSEWNVSNFVPTYTPTSQVHSPQLDVMTSGPFSFQDPWASSYSTGMIDPSLPLYSEDHQYPYSQSPFSSVRSPTPPIISSSVQSAESLVTNAPAPRDPQMAVGRFKGQASLMGGLSQATFLTAITLPRATRDAIPHFLDVYWKRFDNLFPLVHRRRFEAAPDEILRAAMAAMGSQFLDGKEDRIRGNQLHEWAWQEVKRILQWNVSTMQTILLCEIFARFRGKRAAIKPSEPFRSLYSRVDTITQSSSDPDTSFGSIASTASIGGHRLLMPGDRWAAWTEAEARRRLLAACFVLDVHTSVYYDLPLMQSFTKPCPPIPLIAASQTLWTVTPEDWEALTTANPAVLQPAALMDNLVSQGLVANAPPLDQAVFLASEALRLPRKADFSMHSNVVEPPKLEAVQRILALFPGSRVGYAYAAIHFTPLHDLLAVSGDSWLFTQKVLESKAFIQHQQTLQQWSASLHAATAARFAAKALVSFLTINDNDTSPTSFQKRRWYMADISDYWAVYVCALICWALGYRGTSATTKTATSTSSSQGRGGDDDVDTDNANDAEELEALAWLHMVSSLSSGSDILTHVRASGRAVVIAVVTMVRKRLEGEAAGGRNRLLVDAVGVMKKLEEGVNWKWF